MFVVQEKRSCCFGENHLYENTLELPITCQVDLLFTYRRRKNNGLMKKSEKKACSYSKNIERMQDADERRNVGC